MNLAKKANNSILLILIIVCILVVLWGLSLVLPITDSISNDFNTLIQEDDNFATVTKNMSTQNDTRFPLFWDSVCAFVFMMLWIASIVSGAKYIDHPWAFAFFMFALVIVLVVTYTLQDSYDMQISDSTYAAFSTDYPKMHWIMQNLVVVILVIGASSGLAVYANIKGIL